MRIFKLNRFLYKGAVIGALAMLSVPTLNLINTPMVAHAVVGVNRYTNNGNTTDDAQGRLREAVDEAVRGNNYRGTDDKNYKGSDLVKNGVTTDLAGKLQRSEQERLITDMNKAVEDLMSKDAAKTRENNGVASNTAVDKNAKSNWLKDLRVAPGIGTAVLTRALGDFTTDLDTANTILVPFQGPLGIMAGIFVILATWLLILTISIDIAYLFSPFIQQTIDGLRARAAQSGKGDGRTQVIVSREAIAALEESENSSSGKKRSPYLIYFMKRSWSMLAFGVLITYLTQGSMFRIVGVLIDLVSGALGF